MKNIINIHQIPWKTSEYKDSYLDGKIHQHKVKVADYVKREKNIESAESELQHVGAYEYALVDGYLNIYILMQNNGITF